MKFIIIYIVLKYRYIDTYIFYLYLFYMKEESNNFFKPLSELKQKYNAIS
jgi:hypothetical protein